MASPSRTAPPEPSRAASAAMLLAAVCLVAMNMRPAITGLGPLLEQIGADTGMSVTALGVLAAVPLVAWALFSPVAHQLSRRFGQPKVLATSLLVLLLGTLVRSIPGPVVSLWIGTAIIGIGIAIINVLMPAVVKREFSGHVPGVTAAYTALLAGLGAVSSGVVVPISHIELGGDPRAGGSRSSSRARRSCRSRSPPGGGRTGAASASTTARRPRGGAPASGPTPSRGSSPSTWGCRHPCSTCS